MSKKALVNKNNKWRHRLVLRQNQTLTIFQKVPITGYVTITGSFTLFVHYRCKFRHRRSIPRPRFPIRVQNFGDLSTFSVDYCILYSECPPYFYFRFVWPTDLESMPHASTLTLIIPTKFEVGMRIHCRVIAFLSADTSRDLVTLTFDLLTLNSCSAWRVTWPTCYQVRWPHAYPFLIYEV